MTEIQTEAMQARAVRIYREGKAEEYAAGTEKFDEVLSAWEDMTQDAFPMPAFGVSIDSLTREELKKGTWVEFLFDGERGKELPFERLLVKCEPDYHGFNLIRYTQGGYNGRCYYLDLREKEMRPFCEKINNL